MTDKKSDRTADRVAFFKTLRQKHESVDFTSSPLDYMAIQEARAFDFGFYWDSDKQIFEQIKDECHEIENAQNEEHLREEVGDLLNAAISLCLYYGFDVKDVLKESAGKFEKRYTLLLKHANAKGFNNFHGLTIQEKLALWDDVKKELDTHKKNE